MAGLTFVPFVSSFVFFVFKHKGTKDDTKDTKMAERTDA